MEVMIISFFLIWMPGQLVEECVQIILLAQRFSHVSFLLPFVKSSKQVLRHWLWAANVMSLCNLRATCDD